MYKCNICSSSKPKDCDCLRIASCSWSAAHSFVPLIVVSYAWNGPGLFPVLQNEYSNSSRNIIERAPNERDAPHPKPIHSKQRQVSFVFKISILISLLGLNARMALTSACCKLHCEQGIKFFTLLVNSLASSIQFKSDISASAAPAYIYIRRSWTEQYCSYANMWNQTMFAFPKISQYLCMPSCMLNTAEYIHIYIRIPGFVLMIWSVCTNQREVNSNIYATKNYLNRFCHGNFITFSFYAIHSSVGRAGGAMERGWEGWVRGMRFDGVPKRWNATL